ncbi:MAG: four helix bundle protein [Chitinophagaceae bacterium]|nr:four helix bundle protein [Chitinophagaceae bacterium]
MGSYKDLDVFKKAFALAMEIFEISKSFPQEEKFSLTDQVRRRSRSVCANFGEAYRRRKYPAHFVSKLTDADAENTETEIWIKFSFECRYISEKLFNDLENKSAEVGRTLGHMINNPEKYF